MIFPCMEFILVMFQVFHDFQSLWEPCGQAIRLESTSGGHTDPVAATMDILDDPFSVQGQ